MKSNLITYNEAFNWSDQTLDRSINIQLLNDALKASGENGDNLYYHPELFIHNSSSLELFNLLWANDFAQFQNKYKWIKEPQYQVLTSLRNYLRPSPNNSESLISLQNNTGVYNNAWFGLSIPCPEYLVFDKKTWEEFHRIYINNFTFQQKGLHYVYFKKFYQPNLKTPQNQIQQQIDEGRVHNSITRIDPPKIPFEKIHIHFNNNENCALNIDGSWKHEIAGFIIPQDACVHLNEWGFILPRQYYQP